MSKREASIRQYLAWTMTVIASVACIATSALRGSETLTLELQREVPGDGSELTLELEASERTMEVKVTVEPAVTLSGTFGPTPDDYGGTLQPDAGPQRSNFIPCSGCEPIEQTSERDAAGFEHVRGEGGIYQDCRYYHCPHFTLTLRQSQGNEALSVTIKIEVVIDNGGSSSWPPAFAELWVKE